MTEENTVETEETLEEGTQEAASQDTPEQMPPQPTPPPLKSGYVIGIGENDQFVFEILGSEPSVVDLLGLHKLAGDRIEARVDFQLGGETATILAKLDSIINLMTGTPVAPGGNKLK
jgi:hypothetical protein